MFWFRKWIQIKHDICDFFSPIEKRKRTASVVLEDKVLKLNSKNYHDYILKYKLDPNIGKFFKAKIIKPFSCHKVIGGAYYISGSTNVSDILYINSIKTLPTEDVLVNKLKDMEDFQIFNPTSHKLLEFGESCDFIAEACKNFNYIELFSLRCVRILKAHGPHSDFFPNKILRIVPKK